MWAAERLEEGIATTPGQLVLDGFGDEAAAIPLEPIDSLDEVAGKRHGDALAIAHARSMAQSMIILNRQQSQGRPRALRSQALTVQSLQDYYAGVEAGA